MRVWSKIAANKWARKMSAPTNAIAAAIGIVV
jgi:hypothetical protein